MFRAQSNIFDDVVVKATDENLTSENWEYILVRYHPLEQTRYSASCWSITLQALAQRWSRHGHMIICILIVLF